MKYVSAKYQLDQKKTPTLWNVLGIQGFVPDTTAGLECEAGAEGM